LFGGPGDGGFGFHGRYSIANMRTLVAG
jgi:hypothetical protein